MPEIIAHRGSSFTAPENTLAAVELAWAEGADAVEVDGRLTTDGVVVALHDADLRRTAGIDRRIDELQFADLEQIDVGAWKGSRFTGERTATLESLLATMRPGKRFFVDIKCGMEIVGELVRVVRSSPAPSSVVPIGLSLPVMRAVKQALPTCKVFGVFEFERSDEDGVCRPTADELVAMSREYQLDGVDLDARGPITAEMVSALKTAQLDICVWTVDEPERARELIAAGVEGITTNRPSWLRSELGL